MKLEMGEIICDECDGNQPFCPKCKGHGKVDWIENIIGKSTNSWEDGRWHHFTVIKQSSVCKLYIDGLLYPNNIKAMEDVQKHLNMPISGQIKEDQTAQWWGRDEVIDSLIIKET